MFRHVLVPLDGSTVAEQALEYAKQVVTKDGRISLLTVIDLPATAFYAGLPIANVNSIVRDADLSYAEEYLAGVVDKFKTETELDIQRSTVTGRAIEAITSEARRLDVDAIVMSTHGRSGLRRLLMGSVTQGVLTVAPCPVLVIPGENRSQEVDAQVDDVGVS